MGGRAVHTVADFLRGGVKKDRHRLFLALRRETVESPVEWTGVRGLPLKIEGWPDLKLFTYRDGPVVFACEYDTGITLAIGMTEPRAKTKVVEFLAEQTPPKLKKLLQETFELVNPGPKPELEIAR